MVDVGSPAAMFAQQAAFEHKIERATTRRMTEFLDRVHALALSEGLYISPAAVTGEWGVLVDVVGEDLRQSGSEEAEVLYVIEQLQVSETPDLVYLAALVVLQQWSVTRQSRRWLSTQLDDALSLDGSEPLEVSATAPALNTRRPTPALPAAAPGGPSVPGNPFAPLAAPARQPLPAESDSGGLSPIVAVPLAVAGLAALSRIVGPRAVPVGETPVKSWNWRKKVKALARSSATGLQARVAIQAMRARRIVFKRWVTRRDGRVRLTHASTDGKTIRLNEAFFVGGYALQYPGDSNAPPGETANCRCVLVAVR